MYGEKVEETEELQLDLSDVKTMYKAQVIYYFHIYHFIAIYLIDITIIIVWKIHFADF